LGNWLVDRRPTSRKPRDVGHLRFYHVAETGQAPSLQTKSGGGTGAIFWRGAGHGPGEGGGRSIGLDSRLNSCPREAELRGCERHVNVFEEGLGDDPSHAVRGLDEVVAGPAGLFAAERVGKDERFGELTSAHQKTGAIDGPWVFKIHGAFFHLSAGPVFASGLVSRKVAAKFQLSW